MQFEILFITVNKISSIPLPFSNVKTKKVFPLGPLGHN